MLPSSLFRLGRELYSLSRAGNAGHVVKIGVEHSAVAGVVFRRRKKMSSELSAGAS